MNISCLLHSEPTSASHQQQLCLHRSWSRTCNRGHLSDTHSLLSVTSVDVSESWDQIIPEPPETFKHGPTGETAVDWCYTTELFPSVTDKVSTESTVRRQMVGLAVRLLVQSLTWAPRLMFRLTNSISSELFVLFFVLFFSNSHWNCFNRKNILTKLKAVWM